MSELTQIVISLLTGLLVGAVFGVFDVSIPAPPNLAGVLGIVGIFAGYKLVQSLGWVVDVRAVLGI
jgi:XapX domain-containing protein